MEQETFPVLLTIRGEQYYDHAEPDATELLTEGTMTLAEDGITLCYQETALTGMEGTTTEFHFSPAEVTITRKGTVTSKMVFIEGRQNLFLYETPFGSATLGVDTRKITNTLTEHGGELDIDYSLHFDRMMVSQNRFLVKIKEQAV